MWIVWVRASLPHCLSICCLLKLPEPGLPGVFQDNVGTLLYQVPRGTSEPSLSFLLELGFSPKSFYIKDNLFLSLTYACIDVLIGEQDRQLSPPSLPSMEMRTRILVSSELLSTAFSIFSVAHGLNHSLALADLMSLFCPQVCQLPPGSSRPREGANQGNFRSAGRPLLLKSVTS